MQALLDAITSWLTSTALSSGSLWLRNVLLGDKQQRALQRILQSAIMAAVQQTVDEHSAQDVQEALMRDEPGSSIAVISEAVSLRQCIATRISPRIDMLIEQGYIIDRSMLSSAIEDLLIRGIQMDAARSGPLASVAELLRYEELAHSARETVTQLELINLKMDAAASFARAGQGDVTALFEQLGLVPPGVHNSLTAWHGSTFTGREWLQDQIDSFLSTNRRGYLVIEGEAGVGKSAFAIWLATCRGYVFHTTMFPGGKHQTAAIRSIARQLSTAYGLENIAAQDAYSPAAGQPSWLHHAINEAGLRRKHQTPDEPLVIVVDGLDEAESTVEPPLGLPQALPDGVFIIVTLRSGTPLRWIRENYGTFKLSRTSSANMDDMRHHIEAVEREPALKQLIHSAGIADSFSSDLMAACEGSWIYLRYVLDEIRTGRRSPLSLKNLPAGLWNFYTENVAKLRTDAQEWEKFFLPILAALASIEEPVTADALGVAAGIPHEGRRIETFLESSWRSFCNVNNSREYDLYHRSLHDYLVGAPATRTDAELEFSISDRLEFRRAVLECHIRLSDVYLEVWGGLRHSLSLSWLQRPRQPTGMVNTG